MSNGNRNSLLGSTSEYIKLSTKDQETCRREESSFLTAGWLWLWVRLLGEASAGGQRAKGVGGGAASQMKYGRCSGERPGEGAIKDLSGCVFDAMLFPFHTVSTSQENKDDWWTGSGCVQHAEEVQLLLGLQDQRGCSPGKVLDLLETHKCWFISLFISFSFLFIFTLTGNWQTIPNYSRQMVSGRNCVSKNVFRLLLFEKTLCSAEW